MEVALRLAGIGPGDEVITSPITWVATANVVVAVGARPVFADVDPRSRNLDLAAVEAAITPRTRAILPVYLAGLPLPMDDLYALAKAHGLRVIEDAAQRSIRVGTDGGSAASAISSASASKRTKTSPAPKAAAWS
jgi:Predicted pyridoxal phosphate-dependent enzyme apparently involved in regulation of cell wall biogenesis